ncbi:MAG: amidohydrolase family protein [Candidatus Helarchaeota archaeon]
MSDQTLFCGFGLIGKDLKVQANIGLTVSNGIIKDVQADFPEKEADFQYPNCVIVPGFINAHTHLGDSFAKDQGLECSIRELVEPPHGLKHQLLGQISNDVMNEGMQNAIQEMLLSGTTTFIDFREGGEKGVHLLKKILYKNAINGIICGRPFPKLETLPKVLEISDAVGLASSNIYDDNELKYIHSLCRKKNKLLLTHVAETSAEYSYALDNFKMSEVERAIKTLDADILIHATWANEEDIRIIAENEKAVVICPRSNIHLGIGYPPLPLLLKNEVLTCLGTDNVMINNLNLFREMEFLFKSTRGRFGINSITSHEILKMVTINPARAFRLDQKVGSIAIGKRADFILLDLTAPNIAPFSSIYDTLVLRVNPLNIIAVFIEGRSVYEQSNKN